MTGSWCNNKSARRNTGVFGCHVHRVKKSFRCDGEWSGDVLPYAFICKPYTRTHPYPVNTIRINPIIREKAAIIMLRKKGYPINMLAKFLGRSTSYIHRTLRTAIMNLTLRSIDMRKLPGKARLYYSGIRWRKFQKFWTAWEKWIFGEGEKPP